MWIFLVAAVVLMAVRKAGDDTATLPVSALPPGTELAPQGVEAQIQQRQKTFVAIGGIAGSSASLLATSVFKLGAAAGPIGAAIAGAVVLIGMLRGTAHLTANDFVKRIQDPFHQQLSAVLDPHDQRMNAGTETAELAELTYNTIVVLWEEFQIAAAEYAHHSDDAALVVRQGLHTLNGPSGLPGFPGGFINTVLSKLDREIEQLSGNPLAVYA
jgi:hypothetical protein